MKELTSRYKADEKILERLKVADRETEKKIYKEFREFFLKTLVKYYHCAMEEAAEIYPECFAYFCLNIRQEKLTAPLQSKLSTYLCNIGWRHLLKTFPQYRSEENRPQSLMTYVSMEQEELENIGGSIDVWNKAELEAKADLIRVTIQQIDKKCQEVLQLRFWEDASHEEIKVKLGFNTVGAARKRNFDCLKKLEKRLMERKDLDQYF